MTRSQKNVTVYRNRDDIVVLGVDATLVESDLLTGWEASVAELFG